RRDPTRAQRLAAPVLDEDRTGTDGEAGPEGGRGQAAQHAPPGDRRAMRTTRHAGSLYGGAFASVGSLVLYPRDHPHPGGDDAREAATDREGSDELDPRAPQLGSLGQGRSAGGDEPRHA